MAQEQRQKNSTFYLPPNTEAIRSLFRDPSAFVIKVKKNDPALFPRRSTLERLHLYNLSNNFNGQGTRIRKPVLPKNGSQNEGQIPRDELGDIPVALSHLNVLHSLETASNLLEIQSKFEKQNKEAANAKSETVTRTDYDSGDDDEAGRVMIDEIEGRAVCTDLMLKGLEFSFDVTAEIFDSISRSHNLLKIYFWGCTFRFDANNRVLLKAFQRNTRIKLLDLSQCGIGDAGCVDLCVSLETNRTLRKLNLNRNRLGDEAGVALGKMLQKNETLFTLLLTENSIGEDGGTAIAKGVARNEHLGILKLSKNFIGKKGADRFSEALKINQTLLELEMNFCHLEQSGVDCLLKALKFNQVILKLDVLDGNVNMSNVNPPGGVVANMNMNNANAREEFKELKKNLKARIDENKNYFKQIFQDALKQNKRGPWSRTRLFFIGQGKAGKTATVRALLKQPFREEWDSTIGASLTQLSTRADDDSGWMKDDDSMNDFTSRHAARILASQREKRLKRELELEQDVEPNINFSKSLGIDPDNDFRLMAKTGIRPRNHMNKKRRNPLRKTTEPTLKNQKFGSWDGHGSVLDLDIDIDRKLKNNTSSYNDEEKALASKVGDLATFNVEEFMTKPYEQTLQYRSRQDREALNFSIWDFGGQEVFYTMHHLFLTKHGLYFLCFNCTEIAEFLRLPDQERDKQAEDPRKYFKFWLNSVMVHAVEAPIFVIGTHLDEIEAKHGGKKLLEINDFLSEILQKNDKKRVLKVISNKEEDLLFFPVDNRTCNGIHKLQLVIEQQAREQEHVKQDVPIRWMACLDKLLEISRKGFSADDNLNLNDKNNELQLFDERNKARILNLNGNSGPCWLSRQEVRTHAALFEITSDDELEMMLKLFNELGVLIYLNQNSILRQKIILQPQWLLNILGKVIRDATIHSHFKSDIPSEMFKQVKLDNDVVLAYKKGLFSRDLLEFLWRGNDVEFLLELMKYTMLISEWQWRLSGNEKLYLVPSLLRERDRPSEEVEEKQTFGNALRKIFSNASIFSTTSAATASTAVPSMERKCLLCYFDFSEQFLPVGVFERLVCLIISLSQSILPGPPGNESRSKDIPVVTKGFCELRFSRKSESVIAQLTVEEDKSMIQLALLYDDKPARRNHELLQLVGSKLIQFVTSILKKINSEVMSSSLEWTINFQTELGELVSKASAEKIGLFPWFSAQFQQMRAKLSLSSTDGTSRQRKTSLEAENLIDLDAFTDLML